jgi:trehalose-6-phosphate synthase
LELVAGCDDEGGALLLSQLTGAARELTEARIVDPAIRASGQRGARARCTRRHTHRVDA